jgi:hypothetical protein
MKMNPKKQTTGATLMRRTLKISGSKAVSVEPGQSGSRCLLFGIHFHDLWYPEKTER